LQGGPASYAAGVTVDQDSRARTHLANERTFLAWFRTGITLVALGLAAAQFLARDVAPGVPLVRGLSTIVIATGAGIVVLGMARYRTGRRRIDAEAFEPAGRSITIVAAAALVVAALGIVFVWLLHEG
jgi:putative membrane protein